MLWMETIAKIRQRHIREVESISSIARDLHLSRATVRKYLQDDQIQSGYKELFNPNPSWVSLSRYSKLGYLRKVIYPNDNAVLPDACLKVL